MLSLLALLFLFASLWYASDLTKLAAYGIVSALLFLVTASDWHVIAANIVITILHIKNLHKSGALSRLYTKLS